MDLMFDPPTEKEKLILSRGIGYLFQDTRIYIYLRKDIFPINQESFSFVSCLPNHLENNGVISVVNSLNPIPKAMGYESKNKLFKHLNLIKEKISKVPELTLVWEGKMNDPSLS